MLPKYWHSAHQSTTDSYGELQVCYTLVSLAQVSKHLATPSSLFVGGVWAVSVPSEDSSREPARLGTPSCSKLSPAEAWHLSPAHCLPAVREDGDNVRHTLLEPVAELKYSVAVVMQSHEREPGLAATMEKRSRNARPP